MHRFKTKTGKIAKKMTETNVVDEFFEGEKA